MAIETAPLNPEGPVARKSKILVVRPDRIGDVVLSTPVLEALKHSYPDAEIHMLVRESVVPVVQHNPFLSNVVTYSPESNHAGFAGVWRLMRALQSQHYDIAITLQVSFAVSLALLFAGIRYRVGPYSKWYSYLFFNRGTRQSRSTVEMHETDYNLMLLRKLGIRAPSRRFEPSITVDAEAKDRMRTYVRNLGIDDGAKFVVVHPGMGGSALNWPEGYYVDLIARLASRGVTVVITGGIHEKALVERVLAAVKDQGAKGPVHEFLGANSPTGLADLVALLSLAHVMVAPSTGPLHIAAALGKRTVSFYSPIKVQSAIRWGPYAAVEDKHHVLVPDALCGQDFKCAGRKCHFFFCMERLGVEEALSAVIYQLGKEN
ncbi:MAG: glycosyltransferase family 9 protein [Deltaproteobacteria bacterium]|nr:glycosyltransferase family 9 protein [Deltaproteobacteria bacterium]